MNIYDILWPGYSQVSGRKSKFSGCGTISDAEKKIPNGLANNIIKPFPGFNVISGEMEFAVKCRLEMAKSGVPATGSMELAIGSATVGNDSLRLVEERTNGRVLGLVALDINTGSIYSFTGGQRSATRLGKGSSSVALCMLLMEYLDDVNSPCGKYFMGVDPQSVPTTDLPRISAEVCTELIYRTLPSYDPTQNNNVSAINLAGFEADTEASDLIPDFPWKLSDIIIDSSPAAVSGTFTTKFGAEAEDKKAEVPEVDLTGLSFGKTFDDADVPEMIKGYVVSNELEFAVQVIANSYGKPIQNSNLLLVGPAGSGKTAFSSALATLLHKSYAELTLGPDTTIDTLFGGLRPVLKNEVEVKRPVYEDILNDPEGACLEYGVPYTKNAGTGDIFNAILSVYEKQLSAKRTEFVYEKPAFLKVLCEGGVVCLDEVTNTNPQILKALNGCITGEAFELPDGTTVRRHPDSVIVATTNAGEGYVADMALDQSFIDRFQQVVRLAAQSVEDMTKWAVSRTGTNLSEKVVRSMAKTIVACAEALKARDLNVGACGFRALLSWISAKDAMPEWDMRDLGINAIVNRASISDEDGREELTQIIYAMDDEVEA